MVETSGFCRGPRTLSRFLGARLTVGSFQIKLSATDGGGVRWSRETNARRAARGGRSHPFFGHFTLTVRRRRR